MKLHAPAKINLFLRILAQERSGFHQLETLFSALAFADVLTLTRSPSGVTLEVEGIELGSGSDNLAYRAAEAFLREGKVPGGVRIHLEKRIPPAAGLGGGSSDAASTLLGMDALFPDAMGPEELLRIAGALGSDVPFFLSPSPLALAWGRGDRLLPLPTLPLAWILLAFPPLAVPTPLAFRLLAEKRGESRSSQPPVLFPGSSFSSWEAIGQMAQNHFEDVIFQQHPLLGRIREALEESGCEIARMSGSGSTLFGLYLDEESATRAVTPLQALFPDTRFLLSQTATQNLSAAMEEGVE